MMRTTFKDYLVQTLDEMAIKDYQTIGDFSKNSSIRDPRDRRLIQHPRTIEILKKKFNNNEHDFNLYFVNTPQARKFSEVGLVTMEWVKQNLGDEVFNAVSKGMQENEDSISVIFTNNSGAQRRNLTAWMIGHRIGHALARENGSRRSGTPYSTVSDTIIRTLSSIMELYGRKDFPDSESRIQSFSGTNQRMNQLAMIHFFSKVCTFKSARDGKIRDWFEVLNELIAQYLTTGTIRFNPAPQSFGGRNKFSTEQSNLDEIDQQLSMLRRDLEMLLSDLMMSVANQVLVM